MRLSRWLTVKKSTCQCRSYGFDTWVGKIPWKRGWQPTPVFLTGNPTDKTNKTGHSHGFAESDTTE